MALTEQRTAIARAIWNIRREDEDRCDIDLEDLRRDHSVWREADAAIAALPKPEPVGHYLGENKDGADCVYLYQDIKKNQLLYKLLYTEAPIAPPASEQKPVASSDLDVLRRISERGLKLAQANGPAFIDLFQHLIDEISRQAPVPEVRRGYIQRPLSLHDDTWSLVLRFSQAMANKLEAAEKKYGHSNGWMSDEWLDECREDLVRHLEKGDPRDVANYCAFLWFHGEKTTSAPKPDYKAQRDALLDAHRKIVSDGDFSSPEGMKRIALDAIASVKGGE